MGALRECGLFFGRVRGLDYLSNYCLEWNADGSCAKEYCEDRHYCLHCSSSRHAIFECVHVLGILIETVEVGGYTLP
jgi:hypothetical protein